MSSSVLRRFLLLSCLAAILPNAAALAQSATVPTPEPAVAAAPEAVAAPAAAPVAGAQTAQPAGQPLAQASGETAAQPAAGTAESAGAAAAGPATAGAATTESTSVAASAAAETAAPVGAAAEAAVAPASTAASAPSGIASSESAAAPERESLLPHDLSPWGMFINADMVVKAVMIGLAFASVVTWAVLLVKLAEIWAASRSARKSAELIARAPTLAEAVVASAGRRDPASEMLRAAATELDRSAAALDMAGTAGLKERVTSYLSGIVALAGRRAGIGTGVLATIGSTAPFVGLFGTVWGIMNSFIGISESQTTNLAVVAPGIAEALLATALGLVAAIPAVVIYNFFARQITGYRLRLTAAAAGVERLVSRDLDFRAGTGA